MQQYKATCIGMHPCCFPINHSNVFVTWGAHPDHYLYFRGYWDSDILYKGDLNNLVYLMSEIIRMSFAASSPLHTSSTNLLISKK